MGRDYIESFEFDGAIGQLIAILQKIKEKYGDIDMVTDVSTSVRDIEFGTINVVEYYGARVIMNLRLSALELRISDSESLRPFAMTTFNSLYVLFLSGFSLRLNSS